MAIFQKISATQIFDGNRFLEPDKVLIIKNGIVDGIVDKELAGDDIQLIEGIVCPGFINTHCHLELSYLNNTIPQQTGMVDFLLAVMGKRNENAELIQQAIADTENEMIKNGIVAVGDICNTGHTISQKQKNNLHYTNFIEISGFVPTTAQKRFDEGRIIREQFLENNLQAIIVPHSPYSVSKELAQLIYKECEMSNSTLSIHYNESKEEKEFMQYGTGDFTKLYQSLGIDIGFWKEKQNKQPSIVNTQLPTLLVHNVVTTTDDIQILLDNPNSVNNNWFCLCPNANLYIGNGLPDVAMLMQNELNICLGTDSLASNTQICIEAEIKTLQKHFPTIPIEFFLQWATSSGAKALGIDNQYGSFEKGKSGKFVIF